MNPNIKNNHQARAILSSIILLSVLLSGCMRAKEAPLPVPSDAEAGDIINMSPCVYERGDVEYDADCGRLIVQENRADPNSRLISVPVTVVHSKSSKPGEPIFYLPGGPGASNQGFSRVNWFIDKHDIVIVGFRGVDGSVKLDCPEVSQHIRNLPSDMLGEASMENMTTAYASCAERLHNEGVDLDGYTVVDVIDDMEAARLALGYEKINLYSISYGTRLAMIYDWRYPESIYRSAMVAVNPPGHMFYYDPVFIDQQLAEYGKLCASDPKCSAQTDDLAATMLELSQNLPDKWLGMPIDRGMMRAASFESLSDTQAAPKVFDVWLAASKGDYSGMALLSLAGPMMFAEATVWGDNMAKAASIDYEATRTLRSEINFTESILGSPRSEIAAAAAGWPVKTVPAEYQQIQPSDVETLLLSGSIDLWTPMQFAEDEFLPSLSNGQHVIVSNMGHAEMLWRQPEASERLLTSFFDTGVADDSLFVYQPWEYHVGLGFPAMAKLIAAAIVLLIGAFVVVARKIIKKNKNITP